MQRRVFRYFYDFWNDIISEESVVDQEALSTFLEEARMLFDASEIDLELPYYFRRRRGNNGISKGYFVG